MTDKLTIILPLKDRPKFTARFLDLRLPFPLIIADGSREPQLFARTAGDYFYAGHDVTHSHWWFKMLLAVDRIKTPYVMVADNDDFPLPPGLNRCVEFLESNPDYVCASGRVQGFWLYPSAAVANRFTDAAHWAIPQADLEPVGAPLSTTTAQYAPYDTPADYGADNVSDRVIAGFANSWSYYAVYRTEAFKTIWREVHDIDFTDLQAHEKFCAMRTLTLGKARCDGSFASYLRQYGTSIGAGSQRSFAERLLRSRFSEERDRILGKMEICGVDVWALRQAWAKWYDDYLARNYGFWPQLRRRLKARFPKLGSAWQHRHQLNFWQRSVWDIVHDATRLQR